MSAFLRYFQSDLLSSSRNLLGAHQTFRILQGMKFSGIYFRNSQLGKFSLVKLACLNRKIPFCKVISSKNIGRLESPHSHNMHFLLGITKPCSHLHPVPPSSIHLHPAHFNLHPASSTPTQFISASTQLSSTPSTIFEPKYCT